MHTITCKSGMQSHNQHQYARISKTFCVEDHSSRAQVTSYNMERTRVVGTSDVIEYQFHVMRARATSLLAVKEDFL